MENNLTVIFSTRKLNTDYVELIKETSGLHHIEIIPFENPNGKSLTEIYNEGLKMSSNDKVLFCHDDLKFDTKNWGKKILSHFKRNNDLGILGVAGTRYLSESGRWWEDFGKMHGAVYHEHEGKRWLSRYSKDKGTKLDNVMLVDGLFFVVDKNNIKEVFDESVNGFHFYEVDFCLRNYLKSVRVSVCTDIKLTHLSIGQTNEQWEENRKIFAEKYKEHLPIKIDRVLDESDKLNILIGCLNFNDYTGSELYVYELAKGYKKLGHNVTICSNIGGEMVKKVKSLGIETYTFEEPPGFKRSDGNIMMNSPNGPIRVPQGQLYRVSDTKFDILHLNHKPVTEHFLNLYPNVPSICTIHSEVIELEEPVISDRISHYICIRPEIQNYIVDKFNVPKEKTSVIYNPFDSDRFKNYPLPKSDKKRVLFVGTIDYLREKSIIDLVEKTKNDNKELWVVGKKRIDIPQLNQSHVKYFSPTWRVEEYIKECHETAGILLGRTTIEGWLCGRPGWIYNVDNTGEIIDVTYNETPTDIGKFKSNNIMGGIVKIIFKTI